MTGAQSKICVYVSVCVGIYYLLYKTQVMLAQFNA